MRFIVCLAILGLFGFGAWADTVFRDRDDPDAPTWSEAEVILPPLPTDQYLVEFYAGPAATNRFYIDGAALSVGKDGVVRYTLVVKTGGGAINITHEGIRCDTGEYRIYATGRSDGSWAKSRLAAWRPIENKLINRHHAALNREYFCPQGIPIGDPQEGREALRLGRNPKVPGGSSAP